ncbi:MAG: pentapeptide repeat-containing protein [Planctomycetes bacterium]|nr:pentapeptide repeat-containing protein [Planctomycetota bacterium]MCB9887558.1 pentapeptide repeat-containing protein [Planctomycetota bacterium]
MAKPPIQPERAIVRPRVFRKGSSLPRLLEEEIADLLAVGRRQCVHLAGSPGAGKSTALRHLAAAFAGEARLALFDGLADVGGLQAQVIVETTYRPNERPVVLRLAPWSADDALEYLLASGAGDIAGALAAWRRAGDDVLGPWPVLASRVLDRLAAGASRDVRQAITAVIAGSVSAGEALAARRAALRSYFKVEAADASWPFLTVPVLRATLAARALIEHTLADEVVALAHLRWDPELLAAIAAALREEPDHVIRLLARLEAGEVAAAALSLLCCAQPGFRPPRQVFLDLSDARAVGADLSGTHIGVATDADFRGADLRSAVLAGAVMHNVRLAGANLDDADLTAAQLAHCKGAGLSARRAKLERATCQWANLTGVDLTGADLERAVMGGARLAGATLRGAYLTMTLLDGCDLEHADLSGARCLATVFDKVDLRTTQLSGALCEDASFVGCDLSGTDLPGFAACRGFFHRATLTATRWPGADLRAADLRRTRLAEVDWHGADLRGADFTGATFQTGSSRSGLVDSPIAQEGSRTGFYTDESLEQHFQPPEAVRKANLCDCDLRGARLSGVDFYLVDLRGARLDPEQRSWLRRCRAILDADAETAGG